MKFFKAFLMTVIPVLVLAACSSAGLTTDIFLADNYLQSPAQVKALLADQSSPAPITVLDVRTPEEFSASCLEGAKNLDYQNPAFMDGLAKLDQAGVYLVYCRTGRRSAEAVSLMRQAGFSKIIELKGGITAWQSAGNSVNTNCR